MVSLNVSVCYETSGECEFTVTVLDNVKLPKLKCDWGLESFAVNGKLYPPTNIFSSPKNILPIDKLNNQQLSVCQSKILFLATKMHFLDIKQCVLN